MKTSLYCPDCKREYLIESYTPPVHCGVCKVMWNRRVELCVDPGAGDVSAETPSAPHIEVPRA